MDDDDDYLDSLRRERRLPLRSGTAEASMLLSGHLRIKQESTSSSERQNTT
jgi:hypothetical protein